MTKFLKRMNQAKAFMKIDANLLEMTYLGNSSPGTEFQIEWKRGPQRDVSQVFKFS